MEDKKFLLKVGTDEIKIRDSFHRLQKERIVQRIWNHDYTVWKPEPTEIGNRLGWLHCPEMMVNAIDEITSFANEVRLDGFKQALLLGMGGSSLAPEVFRFIFGVKAGYLDLRILDSTHPGSVLHYTKSLAPDDTLYIASTKSGGTVETLSFLKYFYNQTLNAVGTEKVSKHFIAITDPGSGLESLAMRLNFRKIFLNDPNIGGRYSALSYFGLVPAGLIGIDLKHLLSRAQSVARDCESNLSLENENSCVYLGTILGEMARQGRDKLTFIISPAIEALGVWIEQLIAESTGKEGTGILPVIGEPILKPEDYKEDRIFVYLKFNSENSFDKPVRALNNYGFPVIEIHIDDKYDLAREFFRWEMATAIAGHFMKINPFDQPNVESAKTQARKLVSTYLETGKLPESVPLLRTEGIAVFEDDDVVNLEEALSKFIDKGELKEDDKKGDYVAIQAFLHPTSENDGALQELRTKIQKKYRLATTVGYGPRFLHSTGQLHKGDSGKGLFIQITEDVDEDAAIPDKPGEGASSMTFGVLLLAQALGDRQALLDANRKVIRFHLSLNTFDGIQKLISAIY